MKVKKARDLLYMTYHMVDWKSVEQSQSDQRCVQCGGPMMRVEAVEDAEGRRYEGLVCHGCRRVIWAKGA